MKPPFVERKMVQRSNSNPERSSIRKNALKPENFTSKGLPLVSAQQRHELTLLRMEDLIMNGVNNVSLYPSRLKKTARELCTLMVDFSTKLTMAKRRILEDPDLYSDNEDNLSDGELFGKQRQRRRQVGAKLVQVPGKLDHASIAAVEIGFHGSIATKWSVNNNVSMSMMSSGQKPYRTNGQRYNNHSNGKTISYDDDPRYNLKMKATLARFESQDFLECCCESGPI